MAAEIGVSYTPLKQQIASDGGIGQSAKFAGVLIISRRVNARQLNAARVTKRRM